MPRLPAFLRAHPQIRLELDLSDQIRSLALEGFDLAIRHVTAPPETHVAWALAPTRSLLVASADYLAAHGTPSTPQDLAAHHCLHYPRTQGAPAWSFVPRDAGVDGVRVVVPVTGGFAANNSEILRDAALAGLGIALVPDFSAQSGLASGHLSEVLPGWRPVDAFGEQLFAIRPTPATCRARWRCSWTFCGSRLRRGSSAEGEPSGLDPQLVHQLLEHRVVAVDHGLEFGLVQVALAHVLLGHGFAQDGVLEGLGHGLAQGLDHGVGRVAGHGQAAPAADEQVDAALLSVGTASQPACMRCSAMMASGRILPAAT